MSQPKVYQRQHDFTDYSTNNPGQPQSGAYMDDEHNAEKVTLDQILTNLALLQRDDTALANAIVHPDALNTATLALIASDWTPKGPWVTATKYVAGDVVEEAGTSYVGVSDHTSGTFATDYAAGKWVVLGFGTPAVQTGQFTFAIAVGTVDAITASFTPALTALTDGMELRVRASGANTIPNPTFNADGLGAKTIKRLGNGALLEDDIVGAGHELLLRYNLSNDVFELLNPNTSNLLQVVSTVTTLRTIPPNTSRNLRTAGVDAANDGGGGDWYAVTGDAPGTHVDNVGTIIVPNGGDGSTAWLRLTGERLAVIWFGAKGDGVTDDTTAIDLAITYQKTLASYLWFHLGTFLTDPIAISSGQVVLSGNCTLKLNAAATGHLFTLTGGSLNITGEGENFILDGNKANQTMSAGLGPDLISSTTRAILDNVKFLNGQRYGFKTNTGADRSSLKNIEGSGMDNVQIFLENTNYCQIDNIVCNDGGTLVHVRNASSHNTISNINARITKANNFAVELWAADAGGGTPVSTNPKFNTITNVTVDGNNTSGGISISGASHNTLTNLTVKNCPSVASIELAFGAEYNTIVNAECFNSKYLAITGTATAIVQHNNLVKVRSQTPIAATPGIFMFYADNNVLDLCGAEGVTSNHSFKMQNASNNTILNTVLRGLGLSAYYLEGTSANNIIDGGTIEGHTSASRYMFQFAAPAATANNVFKNINGDNNNDFSSSYSGPQFSNITRDRDYIMHGSFTCANATTTTIINPNVNQNAQVMITPTNAAAATLLGSAASIYVSTKGIAGNFIVTHSATAAGTETFDYLII